VVLPVVWSSAPGPTLKTKRVRSDQQGSVLLESVIALSLLLLLAGGAIDFGLLFREDSVLINSARVGARTAAALPNGSPRVWVCMIAKSTAKKFIEDSQLNSNQYSIVVEPDQVDLEKLEPDGSYTVITKNFIKVTVSRPSHWYFWSRDRVAESATIEFMSEYDAVTELNIC
jgi:hypothetical protein